MSATAASEQAVSVADAARITGASAKSLRRRIERGTLGSVRRGSRRLVPLSELVRVGLLPDVDQAASAGGALAGHTWDAGARPPAPAPSLRAPWSSPGPQTPPAAPAALPEREARRISAMVELVMHQTRTIRELEARVAKLEARLGEQRPA